MKKKYSRGKNLKSKTLKRKTLNRKTLKRKTLKKNYLRKKILKKNLMKTLKKKRMFGGSSEVEGDSIQKISSKLNEEYKIWCDKLTNILTELSSKGLIRIKGIIKNLVIFIIGILKAILYPAGLIVIGVGTGVSSFGVGTGVSSFVKLIFKIGSLIYKSWSDKSWSGYETTLFKEKFKSYASLWSFKDMESLFKDHQKNSTENLYIKLHKLQGGADNESYYNELGVRKDASDAQIKKAYYDLSLIHHPDKSGEEEKFKLILEAYSCLSNPLERKIYDQGLKDAIPAQPIKVHYTNLNDIPDNKNGDIDVYLLTFDIVVPDHLISSYLKYKIYHTAILLVDRRGDTSVKYHYAYGWTECGYSGIYGSNVREFDSGLSFNGLVSAAERHKFLYANYLGRTNLTPEVWIDYINILGKTDFEGCKYDLLLNNCCSFTNRFTRFLFQDIYWRSDISYIKDILNISYINDILNIDIKDISDETVKSHANKLNNYIRVYLIQHIDILDILDETGEYNANYIRTHLLQYLLKQIHYQDAVDAARAAVPKARAAQKAVQKAALKESGYTGRLHAENERVRRAEGSLAAAIKTMSANAKVYNADVYNRKYEIILQEVDKRIRLNLNKPLSEIFEYIINSKRYKTFVNGSITYMYDNRNIIIINGDTRLVVNKYPINIIDGQLLLRLLSMCCYYDENEHVAFLKQQKDEMQLKFEALSASSNLALVKTVKAKLQSLRKDLEDAKNKSLFNYDINEIKQYVSIHSIIFSNVFHQMRLGRKLSHFYEMVAKSNNSDEDKIQMLEEQKKSHLNDNLEADKFKLNCVGRNSWYSSWYRWTDTCPPRTDNGRAVKGYEDKKIPKYLTDEYLECCSYDLRNIPKF